jgi:acyl-CoA dehydrogenase
VSDSAILFVMVADYIAVDGPDEVHVLQIGRNEAKRGNALRKRIEMQKEKSKQMLKQYGLEYRDVLQLDRSTAKSKL